MANKVRRITWKQANREIEEGITDQSDILYVTHGKRWTKEAAAIVSNEYIDERKGLDENRKMQLFSAKSLIENDFPGLTKRQKEVILKYSLGMTQKEIAAELNISQARVNEIMKAAVKKLKKNIPEFKEE